MVLYNLLTAAVAFIILVGCVALFVPLWQTGLIAIVAAMVLWLIYDCLRSGSPRNIPALQTEGPGLGKLGNILFFGSLLWLLVYFGVFGYSFGGSAHSDRTLMYFARDEASQIAPYTLPVFSLSLLALLFWAWLKKIREKHNLAVLMGLSIGLYPAIAIFIVIYSLFWGMNCSWRVRQKIRGNDNRTYYLLHSPPPLNGQGHNVIARQVDHTPISVTVQIVTPDYGSGNLTTVLSEGSEDKDPKVRQLCKMLLQSKKGWGKEKY